MFWKKTKTETRAENKPTPVQKPATPSDELANAKAGLAVSLRKYSEAAYENAKAAPDKNIEDAHRKVGEADKLVREGRIAFALGECLPEHIKHWHAWIKRDDFHKYVGFEGRDIEAIEVKEGEGYDKIEKSTVRFTFQGKRYTIILTDKGMSSVPGSTDRRGSIELFLDDTRLAKFAIKRDLEPEFPHWEYACVEALKVGPWMKDILDIAAQIEAHDEGNMNSYMDEHAQRVSKNIEM